MEELLTQVLNAHGGLENWERVTRLTAQLSFGGPFWAARGWPDVYTGQTARLDTRREHITFVPFSGPERVSTLDVDPERVKIETTDGLLIEQRNEPRNSFPAPFDAFKTPWDAIQVAYFTSVAVWNYLTEPFGFTYPGVEAHEIEPWEEQGQSWRRLAVRFPPSNANHNPDQVFYYDEEFMQRRMDYAPDVTGNPPIAHYTHEPRTFDGFVVPTRRLVHLRDENGVANKAFAPITLDVDDIAIEGQ